MKYRLKQKTKAPKLVLNKRTVKMKHPKISKSRKPKKIKLLKIAQLELR